MPRTLPAERELVDHGIVEVRTAELGGYTVDYLTVKQPVDMSPLLKGLPDDSCQCPHVGVVTRGQLTVRYTDGTEETVRTGDAFHMAPGHVPSFEAGTELVQFSPTDELKATDEAITRNMATLQGT
jgi:hypothetical protein